MAKMTGGKKLVIVESPTKAKTIRKFLGKNFVVTSCMGHVRDLPQSAKDIPAAVKKKPWATLGVNVDEEFEPIYCIPSNKTKIVNELKTLSKDAAEIYLATDEDREGESISWHLLEILKPRVPVRRMVFHEITKEAIDHAISHPRDIDENLVRAQEARRILDRLVGYTISPLIWKKVAYGLSAGRVQSVAVRLLCEREFERMKFKRAPYWGVTAQCEKSQSGFEARLIAFKDKRVATGKDFDGATGQLAEDKKRDYLALGEQQAAEIRELIKKTPVHVTEVEEKPVSRKPAPPFITSTLQQESSRKLGMSAAQTMRTAQALYEQGFITYMRTDSTFLSQQAIEAARASILELYGKDYLPDSARTYLGKKAKGAQEAHEAIRPAGTHFVHPEETGLSGEQLKLYDLIWKRTMACQMKDARQKQVSVRLMAGPCSLSASGMTIEFPGFLRAYVEGHDDPEAALEEREMILPPMKAGEVVKCVGAEATSHETKPPARFTEATLIQTLEKEGIGRPSTYAPTISTIVDRGYVQRTGGALIPTFTALIVNRLLSEHLPQYVDLGFTSEMEKSLDDIADGDLDSLKYLKNLYRGKEGLKAQVDQQDKKIDPEKARALVLDGIQSMSFRVGRYGAYVCRKEKDGEVCASLPENQAPADITFEIANKLIDQKINGADALGKDPATQLPVYVLTGRYGPYVQLGESSGENAKPKRVSLPAGWKMEEVTMPKALDLLSLPRNLGNHPESGKEIKAGLGRFGPYIVHDGDFRSIPKTDSLFEINLARALEIMAQPKKGRGRQTPLKELGVHPDDKQNIQLFNGKYGHYVKWGKINASLPQGAKPEDFTLEQAIELVNQKQGEKKGGKRGGKKSSKAPQSLSAKAGTPTETATAPKKPKSEAKARVMVSGAAKAKVASNAGAAKKTSAPKAGNAGKGAGQKSPKPKSPGTKRV